MELSDDLLLLKFPVKFRLINANPYHQHLALAHGSILGLWIPNVRVLVAREKSKKEIRIS